MGDEACGSGYDCHHLVVGSARVLCANLVELAPAQHPRRECQHKVSNLCPGPDPDLRSRLQLHQFLRSLFGHDWHLLQVSTHPLCANCRVCPQNQFLTNPPVQALLLRPEAREIDTRRHPDRRDCREAALPKHSSAESAGGEAENETNALLAVSRLRP